jgi:two-component system invasion response regulator UvrY
MNKTIKLAVVEDHEVVRKGVISLISGFGGFDVIIEAGNGKELFDELCSAPELPEILVMDISMPVWDGYETLEAVRRKWPSMKSLILTMHKHEFAIIKMFRNGANGYLLKNCRPIELQDALQSIYDKGIYFSEVASGNLYHHMKFSELIPEFTDKEVRLLKLCHTDMTYTQIGAEMSVSERTVAGYRTSLFAKLGVKSRAGLVVCGIQMGLIPVE